MKLGINYKADVAQMVEQHIRNVWVGGSSPFIGTNFIIKLRLIMKKFLTLLFFSLFSLQVLADGKPNIVISIAPLASLVKMVTGDLAYVNVIQKTGSCPHHFHLKPSDIFKIQNADFLFLIDEKFESSIAKYSKKTLGKKIIISEFKNLHIKDHNFHLWLDINNALVILENIKNLMIEAGLDKEILNQNYLASIDSIKHIKIVKPAKDTLILGESLSYLTNEEENSFKLHSALSLKRLQELKSYIKTHNINCIIRDPEIKENMITNFYNGKLIELDAENWELKNSDLHELYQNYMEEIYRKIALCYSK